MRVFGIRYLVFDLTSKDKGVASKCVRAYRCRSVRFALIRGRALYLIGGQARRVQWLSSSCIPRIRVPAENLR
jgi:hypothetical protein